MKILLKCPSRSRPNQLLETLRQYVLMAAHPELMGIAVSCDVDDATMTGSEIQQQLFQVIDRFAWKSMYYSANSSKIEACNADIEKVDYPWDIIVLVSDDMIPEVYGYDNYIRQAATPDLDCILWFNDGFQGYKLNTLTMFGRTMYERFGYLYHPDYKSLFCDTELTDLCKGSLKDKTVYKPPCIIRHRHPMLGHAVAFDALYARNQRFYEEDLRTYIARKQYDYDLSVLIPTLFERRAKCEQLKESIREKFARLCPGLRLEIAEAVDNRDQSVGLKRRYLLENAKGKYTVFIDDDDEVTDAYFEDFAMCFQSGHDVMRIRGQMGPHTFTHSTEFPLNGKMYVDGVFVRPPNHLNPMLSDIAKMVVFDDATRGEDLKWAIMLAKTGLLKSETRSDHTRIHYIYILGVRHVDPRTIDYQSKHTYEESLPLVYVPVRPPYTPPVEPKRPILRLTPRGFVSK
jgi:hypothetical protein